MQGRGVASKSKRANRGGEGLTLGPDSGDGREDVRDCEELQAGMSKTGGQGRAPGEVADSCLRGVTGTSSRRGRGRAPAGGARPSGRAETESSDGGKDQMTSGKGVRSSYPPAILARAKPAARARKREAFARPPAAEISARSRRSSASASPNRVCARLGDAYQRLVAPPRRLAPTRRLRP